MPPFSVRTLDGTPLSRDGLHGRFVLLHFWVPIPVSNGLDDLPHLKIVADRFGKDDRFTMVSLCLVDDPEWLSELSRSAGHVESRSSSAITASTRWRSTTHPFPSPKSFLIGPDGTLIAKDLDGMQIEKSVTEALGPPAGDAP